MKFHKGRTAIRSPIEGTKAYYDAFVSGELRRVSILSADGSVQQNDWRRISVVDLTFRDGESRLPLEISSMIIEPRASVVDELTRHRHTPQLFVPITGQIMGVVAPSRKDDEDRPDPERIVMVPVCPGEALEVAAGTWHTLPFAFVNKIICLSVMHRDELDSYHDVRDLAAEGWIGVPEW